MGNQENLTVYSQGGSYRRALVIPEGADPLRDTHEHVSLELGEELFWLSEGKMITDGNGSDSMVFEVTQPCEAQVLERLFDPETRQVTHLKVQINNGDGRIPFVGYVDLRLGNA